MQKHLTEMSSSSWRALFFLSVGLKALYKGDSNQGVDVMKKVFCRNPRANVFSLLKSLTLFYRWHTWLGAEPRVKCRSPETSQRPSLCRDNLTVSELGLWTAQWVGQQPLSPCYLRRMLAGLSPGCLEPCDEAEGRTWEPPGPCFMQGFVARF